MTTTDVAAVQSAQLRAMRERCNIRIDGYTYIDTGRDFWMVHHDGKEQGRFYDKDDAYAFADDLTRDLFEAEPVGELS